MRTQIRAENRPEGEMEALFRENREWEIKSSLNPGREQRKCLVGYPGIQSESRPANVDSPIVRVKQPSQASSVIEK